MPDILKSGEANVSSSTPYRKASIAAERKRKWHTKTKNGCRTCKKRRVRCDETKPACVRCLSLNKVCEGYEPAQVWLFKPRRSSTGDISSNPALHPQSPPEENPGISLLHAETERMFLNLNFAADSSWGFTALQTSHQQNTIEQQILATDSILESSPDLATRSVNTQYFTNRSYDNIFHERTIESSPANLVTLMSCLQSIAMETIRGGSGTSFVHLQRGLQALREWKQSQNTLTSKGMSPEDELVDIWVEPIFARLEAAASITRVSTISNSAKLPDQSGFRKPTLPSSFLDLFNAKEKLFEVCRWLYFQTLKDPLCHTAGNSLLQETMELWTEWYQKFLSLCQTIPKDDSRKQIQARLLDIHYRNHLVTLQGESLTMETAWDDYINEHQQHVEACASILYNEEGYMMDKENSSMSFDSVLPPMWQVAMNCRDSQTRHRALDLLRVHHRIWGHEDDCSAVVSAETIILLEEAELLDPASSTCDDIPEHKRVRPLECDISEPGKMVLTYARSPYTVRETTVVPFFTLSDPPVVPFQLWPLAERVRIAGFRGLLTPGAQACPCKSYGLT